MKLEVQGSALTLHILYRNFQWFVNHDFKIFLYFQFTLLILNSYI